VSDGEWWQAELDELRWHWGDAYLIDYLGGGTWVAQRRDSHATISASSPDGLLGCIREDYRRKPVSRCIADGDRPLAPGCRRFLPE
jgi:hypothetical protein